MKLLDKILYELDFKERLTWAPHNICHFLGIFLPRTLSDKLHDLTQPNNYDSWTPGKKIFK